MDAFSYAAQLANIKGIPVIHADMDAFEVAQLRAAHGGKDFSRLLGGTIEEKIKFISAQPLRERQSRNILKDVALDRLAAGDLPPDRKPKLRVLFGAYHKDGILESYSKMKPQVKAVDMDKSSAQEAAEEHNKNMRRNSGAGRVALRGIGANQHSFSGSSARRAIMEKLKEKREHEGG